LPFFPPFLVLGHAFRVAGDEVAGGREGRREGRRERGREGGGVTKWKEGR